MSDPDWLPFIECLDEPPITDEERAKRIADVLAAGSPSLEFCQQLAEMIRPNGTNCSQWRFKLCRTSRGKPNGPNWEVAFEMERLVDNEGKTVDLAVHLIQQRLGKKGHCKRSCENALEAARKMTRAHRFFDEHVAGSTPHAE